jgi:hypothetical protein
MKTYLIIMMALMPFAVSIGQESFELIIKTSGTEIPFDIIQLENHNYVIVGSQQKITGYSMATGVVWMANEFGTLIDSIVISKPDTNVALSNIHQYGEDLLISGFLAYDESGIDETPLYYWLLDRNLNLLYEQMIPLDSNHFLASFLEFRLDGDQLHIAGCARHKETAKYGFDLFIYKYDLQSHFLDSNFLVMPGNQRSSGYLKTLNSDYHIIFSWGAWGYPVGYSSGYYALFDSNLNWLVTDSLPGDIHWDNFAMNLTDSTYLLSGREYVLIAPPSVDEFRSVLYEMAFPNEPIRSFDYHMGTDTTSHPAAEQSFDTTYTGEIYFAGTANIDAAVFPYQETPSWIFLSKLDRNLNPIWTKLYGGDMFYYLYTMKATHDDGAVMACRTYNHLTQGRETDILILKVNQDGLIVGTDEELPKISVQDAIVYPNPGNEYLNIQSGPQINGALFELFDMNGNLVLTTTLDERLETLSTTWLSTGTYPYRITFDNKIVGSGKWLKK